MFLILRLSMPAYKIEANKVVVHFQCRKSTGPKLKLHATRSGDII